MAKKYLIYRLVSPTGSSYVGQTSKTLKTRWNGHCNHAVHRPYMAISKAIVKYGRENFVVITLCDGIPDKHDANLLERYFIEHYDSYRNGYNSLRGSCHKGDYVNKYRTGQKNTARHRQRISDGLMGKTFSPERRANISKGKKGKRPSKEHRKAVSVAIKEFWRKRKSGEYPAIVKTPEGKRCTSCLVFKPYSEYYSKRGICKECTKVKARTHEKF